MSLTKKILSVVLAISMVLGVVTVGAFAADSPKASVSISIDNDKPVAGDIITATVKATTNYDIAKSVGINVLYEKAVLAPLAYDTSKGEAYEMSADDMAKLTAQEVFTNFVVNPSAALTDAATDMAGNLAPQSRVYPTGYNDTTKYGLTTVAFTLGAVSGLKLDNTVIYQMKFLVKKDVAAATESFVMISSKNLKLDIQSGTAPTPDLTNGTATFKVDAPSKNITYKYVDDNGEVDASNFTNTNPTTFKVGTGATISKTKITSDKYDIKSIDIETIDTQKATDVEVKVTVTAKGKSITYKYTDGNGEIDASNFTNTNPTTFTVGTGAVISIANISSDKYDIKSIDKEAIGTDVNEDVEVTVTVAAKTKAITYKYVDGQDADLDEADFTNTNATTFTVGTGATISKANISSDKYDIESIDTETIGTDVTDDVTVTVTANAKTKNITYVYVDGDGTTLNAADFTNTNPTTFKAGTGAEISVANISSDKYEVADVDPETIGTDETEDVTVTVTANAKTKNITYKYVDENGEVDYNFANTNDFTFVVGVGAAISKDAISADKYDIVSVEPATIGADVLTDVEVTVTVAAKTKAITYKYFDNNGEVAAANFTNTNATTFTVGTGAVISKDAISSEKYDVKSIDTTTIGADVLTDVEVTVTVAAKTKNITYKYSDGNSEIAASNFTNTNATTFTVGTGAVISKDAISSDNYDVKSIDTTTIGTEVITDVTVTVTVAEKDADYTVVTNAKATIPGDLTIYTKASVDVLTRAVNAVEDGKKISEQDIVDAWATAIEDAVSKLEKKADYSALEEAKKNIPESLEDFTEDSAKALQEVIAKIEQLSDDLGESKQGDIDALVRELNAAIKALVPAGGSILSFTSEDTMAAEKAVTFKIVALAGVKKIQVADENGVTWTYCRNEARDDNTTTREVAISTNEDGTETWLIPFTALSDEMNLTAVAKTANGWEDTKVPLVADPEIPDVPAYEVKSFTVDNEKVDVNANYTLTVVTSDNISKIVITNVATGSSKAIATFAEGEGTHTFTYTRSANCAGTYEYSLQYKGETWETYESTASVEVAAPAVTGEVISATSDKTAYISKENTVITVKTAGTVGKVGLFDENGNAVATLTNAGTDEGVTTWTASKNFTLGSHELFVKYKVGSTWYDSETISFAVYY